jgi:hypothetical protein
MTRGGSGGAIPSGLLKSISPVIVCAPGVAAATTTVPTKKTMGRIAKGAVAGPRSMYQATESVLKFS